MVSKWITHLLFTKEWWQSVLWLKSGVWCVVRIMSPLLYILDFLDLFSHIDIFRRSSHFFVFLSVTVFISLSLDKPFLLVTSPFIPLVSTALNYPTGLIEKRQKAEKKQELQSSQPFLRKGNYFDVSLNHYDIYLWNVFTEFIKISFDLSEKLEFNLNPLIMCQQVIRTLERDFTFWICLHICFTFFLSPCFCWEWQCDRQSHSGVFRKESFIVIELVTQKLLWSSQSFLCHLSGLVASQFPCLAVSFVYSTEFCGEEHVSFFALSILSLWLLAVCLCVSAVCCKCVGEYVGQTAHPLPALGGLPDRLLLSVFVLFLPFMEVK